MAAAQYWLISCMSKVLATSEWVMVLLLPLFYS